MRIRELGIQDNGFNFRAFFAYFDETRCRWETENDSCDDYVTDSDVTFSGDTDSEIDSEDISDTDTNAIDETSSDDVTDMTDTTDADNTDTDAVTGAEIGTNAETDVTDVITEKPFYQNLECEPLDETWMCSSGSKNHSLCIKFCTIGLDLTHDPTA